MIGLIESVFETYGYIRDQDWDRWCFRPDDILDHLGALETHAITGGASE